MAKIVVYSGPACPYCTRAKALLQNKNAAYEEFDVTADDARRCEMLERSGGIKTIPQIFINDQHIGGCDDLYALDKAGKLDPLLQ